MIPSRALRLPAFETGYGSGRTPLRVYKPQPTYETYISPYGPKTKHIPNLMGITPGKALRLGYIASGFGVAAGIFAVFFFGEVPRVREDILSKLPVIGSYWVREVPPEDNPF
ncbi:Cytochrome b-c1 complex subunit 10 [Cladophialophora carrionii]|uniref:Cytochrome b-c1 complex subunit 10 n=1 Tax=Cladophialophora carrionii TaxID=86049 RepID=A0A1C1CS90_9EURO|nr:Cytochrome b-c1 complex subunit 10 [Cladophialophora carrionii]